MKEQNSGLYTNSLLGLAQEIPLLGNVPSICISSIAYEWQSINKNVLKPLENARKQLSPICGIQKII